MKVKSPGKRDRHFIVGREKEHHLLEGSQASPARPSDKGNVKVKALELGNNVIVPLVAIFRLYNIKLSP
jgi:hypothetical protein